MSRLHFRVNIFEPLDSVVAPRKEHGVEVSGITPFTEETGMKYLKKGKGLLCVQQKNKT
jgi:hypothetical protein